MSNPHKPMAQIAESFMFFLEKRADGTRWPVGTKLYAQSPLIEAAPTTAERAMAFTLLVERYLRDDTGQPTVSESDVATAMYELRAHIAQATGSAA